MAAPAWSPTRAAVVAALLSAGARRAEGEALAAELKDRGAALERLLIAGARVYGASWTAAIDTGRDAVDAAHAAALATWIGTTRKTHEVLDELCRQAEALQVEANYQAAKAVGTGEGSIAALTAKIDAALGTTSPPFVWTVEIDALARGAARRLREGDEIGVGHAIPFEPRDRPLVRASIDFGGAGGLIARAVATRPGAAANGGAVSSSDIGRTMVQIISLPGGGSMTLDTSSKHQIAISVRGLVYTIETLESSPRGSRGPFPPMLLAGVEFKGGGMYVDATSGTFAGGRGGTHAELLERVDRDVALPAAAGLRDQIVAARAALVKAYALRPLRSVFGAGTEYRRDLMSPGPVGTVEDELLDTLQRAEDWLAEVGSP